MADAAVLIGGYLKRTTNLSKTSFNHRSGFLVKFTFNKIFYIHVNIINFRSEDQDSTYATGGYYDEANFLKYKAKQIPREELAKYRLDPGLLENVSLLDIVRVRKLKIVDPYTDFCKVYDISWKYKGSKILDENSNIIIPPVPESTVITSSVTLSPIALLFYQRNIGLVNNPNYPSDQRPTAAYLLAMIALQINIIQSDIFPLFSDDLNFDTFISSQNLEWTITELFIIPVQNDFQVYLNNITGFYNSIYVNQILIGKANSKTKLYWLAYVLSVSALTIMSVSDKIKILKLIAEGTILERSRLLELARFSPVLNVIIDPVVNEEEFVLKLVESVKLVPSQSDDFLDQLLFLYYDKDKNKKTLFEILYIGIDDSRINRYNYGLFLDNDNRMKFIKLLHEIWEKSKYNPFYDSPSYTLPKNTNGIFPESYFMTTAGKKYYDAKKSPAVFEYSTSSSLLSSYSESFSFKFNLGNVNAQKVVGTTQVYEQAAVSSTTYEDYGIYHLFQPVGIVGYKPDLNVFMPKRNCIPIFFLYYANDYKNIKDFDFEVMLSVEMALNFIGIGEIADLKYIGYLKNLSKMGRLAELPATEAVLFWPAVNGVNTALQFSAGSALAVSNYLNNTSTDPDIVRFTAKLNIFLGLLTLGTISLSSIVKARVITAADSVIIDKDYLLSLGKDPELSPNVIAEIHTLANMDELISLMEVKISNLQLTEIPTIGLKYDGFQHQDQFNFFNDYYLENNIEVWNALNKQFPIQDSSDTRTLLDIWQEFIYRRVERKSVESLELFNRFKYLKNDEFKHIWDLHGIIGGHRIVFVTSDFNDTAKIWKIVSDEASINTTIPVGLRTEIYTINGHLYYENLWRFNSNAQPGAYLLEGLRVSKKTKHFVINPSWDKQKLLEEMTFAYKNRGVAELISNSFLEKGGTKHFVSEKTYLSKFSDGTPVEIIYKSLAKNPFDPNGDLLTDHISLLSIIKPKN